MSKKIDLYYEKYFPDGWEEGVTELIGFNPEWVDGVPLDG